MRVGSSRPLIKISHRASTWFLFFRKRGSENAGTEGPCRGIAKCRGSVHVPATRGTCADWGDGCVAKRRGTSWEHVVGMTRPGRCQATDPRPTCAARVPCTTGRPTRLRHWAATRGFSLPGQKSNSMSATGPNRYPPNRGASPSSSGPRNRKSGNAQVESDMAHLLNGGPLSPKSVLRLCRREPATIPQISAL